MKQSILFAGKPETLAELQAVIQFVDDKCNPAHAKLDPDSDHTLAAVIVSCRSARMIKKALDDLGMSIPIGYEASQTELPLTGCENQPAMAPFRELKEAKPLVLEILYATKQKGMLFLTMRPSPTLDTLLLGYPGLLNSRVAATASVNVVCSGVA